MGQFTPWALGGYKFVSNISDEHTRWTEIYLLKSKDGALHAFQSFVQSMVIPSGVRVERLRADKGKGPQLLMQELPPGDDPDRGNKSHNYITDDDFLRSLRSYTSVVDHPGSASTDHVTASRRSENTLVAELLDGISAITRRDLLEDGAPCLGKRLQRGRFRKVAFSNVLSSQRRLLVHPWRHHSQGHRRFNNMDSRAME